MARAHAPYLMVHSCRCLSWSASHRGTSVGILACPSAYPTPSPRESVCEYGCVCGLGVPRIVNGNGEEETCPRARGQGSRSRSHTHTHTHTHKHTPHTCCSTHHLEGPVAAREEVNILEGEVRHNLNHLVLFDTAGRTGARRPRGQGQRRVQRHREAQTRMRTRSTHRGAQRAGTRTCKHFELHGRETPRAGRSRRRRCRSHRPLLCRRAEGGSKM